MKKRTRIEKTRKLFYRSHKVLDVDEILARQLSENADGCYIENNTVNIIGTADDMRKSVAYYKKVLPEMKELPLHELSALEEDKEYELTAVHVGFGEWYWFILEV